MQEVEIGLTKQRSMGTPRFGLRRIWRGTKNHLHLQTVKRDTSAFSRHLSQVGLQGLGLCWWRTRTHYQHHHHHQGPEMLHCPCRRSDQTRPTQTTKRRPISPNTATLSPKRRNGSNDKNALVCHRTRGLLHRVSTSRLGTLLIRGRIATDFHTKSTGVCSGEMSAHMGRLVLMHILKMSVGAGNFIVITNAKFRRSAGISTMLIE